VISKFYSFSRVLLKR